MSALLLLASLPAVAQNVNHSFELDPLEVDPAATGSLVLSTGPTMEAGGYRLSAFGNYTFAPLNTGAWFSSRAEIHDRLAVNVAAAFGLTQWLQVGVQVPFVVYQDTASAAYPGLESNGLATPWVSALLGLQHQDLATGQGMDVNLGVGVGLPVGSQAVLGRDSTLVTPKITVGRSLESFRYGVELAGLVRESTAAYLGDSSPNRAQSTVSLGGTLATTGDTRGEVDARVTIGAITGQAATEILLGGRKTYACGAEMFLLFGPSFGTLVGTPTARAIFGVAFGTPPKPLFRDADKDGVEDSKDKCPNVPGPASNDGCPVTDADKDGVPDATDKCPNEPGPASNQGCPVDTDKDGVPDSKDKCPNEPGPASNDGCPVKDADNDGVPDAQDNCPNEAGPAENHGCPVNKKQLVSLGSGKIDITEKVHFAIARAKVLPRSFSLLDQVAALMVAHPNIKKVRVDGYTDNQGNTSKNLKLSQDRADSVVGYLVKKGIDKDRLEAKGFGVENPVAPNDTKDGREENRRVEFTVVPDAAN